MTGFQFGLGVQVRDRITGFTGYTTGRVEYLTGCAQYTVQPPVKADGEFVEAHWFDEDRLEPLQGDLKKIDIARPGPGDPAPIK